MNAVPEQARAAANRIPDRRIARATPMPRFRLRTLMIGVAVAGVCLAGFHESVQLGAMVSLTLVPSVIMTYRAAAKAARQGQEFGWQEGSEAFRRAFLFWIFAYFPIGTILYILLGAFGMRIS